jgi:hypothetical protein
LYPTRGNLWQSKTYDLGLIIVKPCSDLLASHHRSVIVLGRHGNMEVFESSKGDEITIQWYIVLNSAECITIMIAKLAVTSGLGYSFD